MPAKGELLLVVRLAVPIRTTGLDCGETKYPVKKGVIVKEEGGCWVNKKS